MFEKFKINVYNVLIIIGLCFLLLSKLDSSILSTDFMGSDLLFLHNRVMQLRTCILDGNFLGMFFYNDFYNVGYGSTFFYGYLTLIPFIGLINFAMFVKIFTIVSYMLLYMGTRSFTKRLAKNYEFISFLFMSSLYVLFMFGTTVVYLNFYAVGISLFFLAKCIDFFRDNKSFIPASILFYLLLNTHIITSLLAFLICSFICVYYFDKTRIKEYCKFAGFTILICSYFIVNFMYHKEGVLNTSTSRNTFLREFYEKPDTQTANNPLYGTSIFMGLEGIVLGYNVLGTRSLLIISPIILMPCLYYYIRRKDKTLRLNLVMFSLVVLGVLSINSIWMFLYKHIDILIQFPMRYLTYTVLVFFILCLRNIEPKKFIKIGMLVVSTCYLIVFPMLVDKQVEDTNVDYHISNGEYLSKHFEYDSTLFEDISKHVYDNAHNSYDYYLDKDKLYFIIDKDIEGDCVLVPKLWYKGYVAYTEEGNKLELSEGRSQFIKVKVGDYKGTVCVYHKQPLILLILEVLSYILVLSSLVFSCICDLKSLPKKE